MENGRVGVPSPLCREEVGKVLLAPLRSQDSRAQFSEWPQWLCWKPTILLLIFLLIFSLLFSIGKPSLVGLPTTFHTTDHKALYCGFPVTALTSPSIPFIHSSLTTLALLFLRCAQDCSASGPVPWMFPSERGVKESPTQILDLSIFISLSFCFRNLKTLLLNYNTQIGLCLSDKSIPFPICNVLYC